MLAARVRTLLCATAFAVLVAVGLSSDASQAPPPTPVQGETPRVSRDIPLNPGELWTTTDVVLEPGERAVFTGKGTGQCSGQNADFGPTGIPRGFRDLLRVLPIQAGRGALIGRFGDADGLPFLIGASADVVATAGGPLALGINRANNDACTAEFSVHVDVFPVREGARTRVAKPVDGIDGIDDAFIASIPRRVRDRQGNAGDMVNFLILGSESAMQRVFKAAGWVTVDPDIRGAVITGILDSLSKEAYLTMPMSQLYLFDRPQDFGWAHAEPIKVVESRHHLRVWRAPKAVGDTMVWAGAATHDIGFERDQRTNGVTHKIDPKIDLERDYVEKTLTRTGIVAEFTYVMPKDALREAKTATGGTFQSDGRVLIMKLDNGE
jgi:LssY C-terminus